jgi:hypothetical protein
VAVVATITQVCPNAQAPDRRRPNGWPRVEGTESREPRRNQNHLNDLHTLASAATLTQRGYGQVSVKIVTVPHSLGSVAADGNPCQELDWKSIESLDYFGLPGNDGKTLRAIKGAQLTFRGYSSTDCSGQPASIIIRTFGDPDLTWATGSLYYMPWESN